MIAMFKYFINWFMGWWNKFLDKQEVGKRISFTAIDAGSTWTPPHNEHKVEGYMFTPPVFKKDKLIICCHGGWASFPDIPDFDDVNYYVRNGYNVFILRYDDEFTPEPMDLDIEKDVKDVYYTRNWYVDEFKAIILLGVSRGGFVALHSSIKHDLFDLVIAGCAPSDIEAWDAWGVFKLIGEQAKPYFYQWSSPIKDAEILGERNLLLIHGVDDDLVPVSQAINLFKEINKFYQHINPLCVDLELFSDRGHALMNDKPVLRYVVKQLDGVKK
jgi:dipeptidyl aminopeptidase/acylaminoacyl peptidase